MASKVLTPFLTQLLAPLSEGEEQVESRTFLRILKKDMEAAWLAQMSITTRAHHQRHASENSCSDDAIEDYLAAHDKQMSTPAPSKSALAWKRKGQRFCGGCPEWDAQMEQDQAWLDRFEKAGVR